MGKVTGVPLSLSLQAESERERKQVGSAMFLQGSVLTHLCNRASVCGICSEKCLIIQPK